ncbi:MAG TPA: patatin family protein [Polyangiales bacterium]
MKVRTAIVVEGGAMRGIFSAGVLDGMLSLGLDDFDLAIGSSAGACNLASFLARQHERSLRCYVNIMSRPWLFSVRRALSGGHYMDLDALWDAFAREEPLDEQALAAQRTPLVSVHTCARTAQPIYLTAAAPGVHDFLKAGCALPLLYRGPVRVGEDMLVDGSVADPIPVQEAHRRGARRIVVIRSRPAQAIKRDGPVDALAAALLRSQPGVASALRTTARRYRDAVSFLQKPPADTKIVQIAPLRPLASGRTTQDVGALRRDYALGLSLAQRYGGHIRALLHEPSALAEARPG